MSWPWEKELDFDYTSFMDRHVRVRVSMDGVLIGSFAVVDDGAPLDDVNTVMPSGATLIIKVDGHPRTTDPRMNAVELVNYILEHYK